MNFISDLTTFTASEAREKLYSLIKDAGKGLKTFEITLRGEEPVLLVNKAELEAWQETFDILSSKKEMTSLKRALREKKLISHQEMLKKIGLSHEN